MAAAPVAPCSRMKPGSEDDVPASAVAGEPAGSTTELSAAPYDANDVEYGGKPDVGDVELPPLPEPDSQLRNAQTCSGCVCVLLAVGLCLGVTQGVALAPTSWPFSSPG